MAEIGGNVRSMTGHLTEAMVTEYTRDADQKRLAEATMKKWAKSKKAR